jgi:hypothetical protein
MMGSIPDGCGKHPGRQCQAKCDLKQDFSSISKTSLTILEERGYTRRRLDKSNYSFFLGGSSPRSSQ